MKKVSEKELRSTIRKQIVETRIENLNKSDFTKMSDDELYNMLIERELAEMTGTGSLAVADEPADEGDIEEDAIGEEEVPEEISLDESSKMLEMVLREAYEVEGYAYPSYQLSMDLLQHSFNVKVPKKYQKLLETVYKDVTNKILKENKGKDAFERFIF